MKVHLEYQDEKSSKFWAVEVAGSSVTVRYGRIGTTGQTKTKDYASPAAAQKDAEKQLAAKKKKGYLEAKASSRKAAPTQKNSKVTKAAKTTKSVSKKDRYTVRMELADILAVGEDLFVLAAYPHPTNDWGWSSWEFDGEYLDDSDWNEPWNNEFWRGQVTLDPEEVDATWDDVELEYDYTRVLVRTKGKWTKERLPKECKRLRYLPGLGVCAVGGSGVCVRQKSKWKLLDSAFGANDVVPDREEGLIGVNSSSGYGRLSLARNKLAWANLGGRAGENGCSTPHGTFVAGKGLFRVEENKLVPIVAKSKDAIRLSSEPDIDGSAVAVATNGKMWELSAKGTKQTETKIPQGFYVTLTVARFRGANYVACGKGMLCTKNGTSKPITPAMPDIVDQQPCWPRGGAISVRVTDGKLWAVCAHHLACTEDGKSWEMIPFRK